MRSITRAVASILLIAGALTVLFSASGLALAATTTTATTPTVVLSYDSGRIMFEGWAFTPGGMITGYVDDQPAWGTGPVAPDGHVFGVVFILLSPGQHTAYLVDMPTGRRSNTTTLGAVTTTSTTSSTSPSTTTTSTTATSTTTTSTRVGTVISITEASGKLTGTVTVKGYLRDESKSYFDVGNGLQGLLVRITVDGQYGGTATTGSDGYFSYTGPGPTTNAPHLLTVWFDGGIFTVPVGTTWPNIYVTSEYASSSVTRSYTPS